MELVIDGFTNLKPKVETGIPQGFSVSLIVFFIYISEVFSAIKVKLPDITCVSFVDNPAFLVSDGFMKKVTIFLEKVGKIAVK